MRHERRSDSARRAAKNVQETIELLAARFPRRVTMPQRIVSVSTAATAAENLLDAREAFSRAREKLDHLIPKGGSPR